MKNRKMYFHSVASSRLFDHGQINLSNLGGNNYKIEYFSIFLFIHGSTFPHIIVYILYFSCRRSMEIVAYLNSMMSPARPSPQERLTGE